MKTLQNYIQESIKDRFNESILDSDQEAVSKIKNKAPYIEAINLIVDNIKQLVDARILHPINMREEKRNFTDTKIGKDYKNIDSILCRFNLYPNYGVKDLDSIFSKDFVAKLNKIDKNFNAQLELIYRTPSISIQVASTSEFTSMIHIVYDVVFRNFRIIFDTPNVMSAVVDHFKSEMKKIMR